MTIPFVDKEMLNYEFWVNNSPNRCLLSHDYIEHLNRCFSAKSTCRINDILSQAWADKICSCFDKINKEIQCASFIDNASGTNSVT